MAAVELLPAFVWDCEECGRENFQRAVSQVLDPDDEGDAEIIRREHDLADDEPIPAGLGVTTMLAPNRVTCRHCTEEFQARTR